MGLLNFFLCKMRSPSTRRCWPLAGLLIAAVSPTPLAQEFPGESDLVGNPSRLTQFPDDELALVSFSPSRDNAVPPATQVNLWIQEFSPNPDYTLTVGPTSTAPDPWPQPDDEENIFSNAGVARGRFIDPEQDALVALTKVSVGNGIYPGCDSSAINCINWALQEITFIGPPPKPGHTHQPLPTYSFSAPVVPSTNGDRSGDSPGAIAAGDLDRAVDKDGNYHDEIAIANEFFDGTYAQVALSVFDYAANLGKATVNATVIGLPGGAFAYPCNISFLGYTDVPSCGDLPTHYPGGLNVAVGDFDGDGVNEVAVVVLTFDGTTNFHNLQTYFYNYQPGYTQQPPTQGTLTLMDFTSIDGGAVDKYFQGPVEVAAGDFDGDGKDELAVAHHTNFRFIIPAVGDYKYHAELILQVLEWDPDTEKIRQLSRATVATVEAWYDRSGKRALDPPVHYWDNRLTAGLFKYDPGGVSPEPSPVRARLPDGQRPASNPALGFNS